MVVEDGGREGGRGRLQNEDGRAMEMRSIPILLHFQSILKLYKATQGMVLETFVRRAAQPRASPRMSARK